MAQGIQLAGGFAAGGVRDALVDMIAQRLAQQKFDEEKRAALEHESIARSQLAQTGELTRARLSQDDRQFGERLGLDVKKLTQDEKQHGERLTFDRDELGFRREDSTRRQGNEEKNYGLNVEQQHEQERHNRASEGIAASTAAARHAEGTVKRTVQGVDEQGRPVTHLVDGYGNIVRTIARPANAMVAGKLAPLKDYIDQIDDVLKTGKDNEWADTGPYEARARALVPGGGGFSKKGTDIRTKLGNLFSSLSHERFGGALTPQEIGRAQAFLPEPTDEVQLLESKLTNLRQFMQMKLENLSGSMPIGGADVDIGADAARGGAKDDPGGIRPGGAR